MCAPPALQDDEKAGLLDDGESFRIQDSDADITISGGLNQYKVAQFIRFHACLTRDTNRTRYAIHPYPSIALLHSSFHYACDHAYASIPFYIH